MPRHFQEFHSHQTVHPCCNATLDICLIYVHNPKAGSQYLHKAGLQGSFPELQCEDHPLVDNYSRWPYRQLGVNFSRSFLSSRTFVFTVVRDPIATAVAAYCEVDRRDPSPQNSTGRWTSAWVKEAGILKRVWQYGAEYEAIPCNSDARLLDRYRAFLGGIERHEPLSKAFYHAYPQALKTNVVPEGQFDAIVRLESLEDEFAEMAAHLGLRHHKVPVASASQAHTTKNGTCCPALDVVNKHNSILAKLCELYSADWVCFGYEMPKACRK